MIDATDKRLQEAIKDSVEISRSALALFANRCSELDLNPTLSMCVFRYIVDDTIEFMRTDKSGDYLPEGAEQLFANLSPEDRKKFCDETGVDGFPDNTFDVLQFAINGLLDHVLKRKGVRRV